MLRRELNEVDAQRHARFGVLMGFTAHLMWGLFPLYFKLVEAATPPVILGYRIVWSAITMLVLMRVLRLGGTVRLAFTHRLVLLTLLSSAVLVAANWLTFIYAVTSGHALDASLGYFITPLAIVLLGVVALKETLNRAQVACLLLAGVAVGIKIIATGTLPWIAIVLPATFGLYSLLRKTVATDSRTAMAVETFVLAPFGVAYLAYSHSAGQAATVEWNPLLWGLLVLTGVLTVTPLLLFGAAAKRLRLSTLGFLQYLGPTVQMIVAVTLLGEAFTFIDAAVFGTIWLALAIYTTDAVKRERRRRKAVRDAARPVGLEPATLGSELSPK